MSLALQQEQEEMMIKQLLNKPDSGGVSIFVVIFTALLITIVTTSFVQIMVRNQQQATNNDLSQSAYDAALAGVEDAKRALVKLRNCEGSSSPTCIDIRQEFQDHADECDFLKGAIDADFRNGEEVQIGDEDLNQAYTCVKVKTDTPSVDGELDANFGSKTIHLKGTDSFNRIRVSWYTDRDIREANPSMPIPPVATPPQSVSPSLPLPANDLWDSVDPGKSSPPLLRAQLIQFNGNRSINLSDFSSTNTNNALTAFLYPFSSALPGDATSPKNYFNNDRRLGGSGNTGNSPREVYCDVDNAYKCSVVLALPNPQRDGNANNREAYLQLSALYNATSFEVQLLDGNELVNFDNVQPVVDSTGRASDLFRRVKANVSIDSIDLPVPDAALSVNGDLCKNFIVTNRTEDYNNMECTTPQ